MLYKNTAPFCLWDLSAHGFWYPKGALEPTPTDPGDEGTALIVPLLSVLRAVIYTYTTFHKLFSSE